MSDSKRVVCSVCSAQRQTLHPRKSRLLKSQTLFLCTDCIKGNREPRWLIILVGRTLGQKAVHDYVKNRRYTGELILAEEIFSNNV